MARVLLDRFTQRTLTRLCRDLTRQVLATPLRRLEDVGIPRILATLTDDVAWLGWAAQNVPALATNLAMVAGCSLYLGWLSWSTLLALLVVMAVGALVYRVLSARGYRYLQEARDTRDVLFQHFRTLTEGLKELKIHAPRRRAFMVERIESATDALSRASLHGLKHHLVADTWSQVLFYGLIGGLLFAAPPDESRSGERLTGYILVTLYMMAPMWSIMEAWPIFARARIALQKVHDLGLSLAPDERSPRPSRRAARAARVAPARLRRRDLRLSLGCRRPGFRARPPRPDVRAGRDRLPRRRQRQRQVDVREGAHRPLRRPGRRDPSRRRGDHAATTGSGTASISRRCSRTSICSTPCSGSTVPVSMPGPTACWSSSSSTPSCASSTARCPPPRCHRASASGWRC